MPDRSQGELAEALRRQQTLTADDVDRLLARAITEMNGWAECALLLTLAERQPSEAVKQALFYRCNVSEETSASCAAMLCFLCGRAASPFDPGMADFFAGFGLHANYYQRRDALDKLTDLTGYAAKEVGDFARIERDFHEMPPSVTPSPAAAPPLPQAPPLPRPSAIQPPPLPKPPLLPFSTPAVAAGALSETYDIETEMRGETLHYIEPGRRVSMGFYWTREYLIEAETIRTWVYADGRTEPVTAKQRVDVVARIVDYARREQKVSMKVESEAWMRAEARREEIAAMRQLEVDLERSSNHLDVYITIAHKWTARVKQLVDAQQHDDAINAYHRGVMWAGLYASGATSGGEGVANSRTRDEVVAQLRDTLGKIRPGDDPTGDKAKAAVGEGPLS